MPSSPEILEGLSRIAEQGRWAAIGWHLALLVGVIALALGLRPSRRVAAWLIAAPLASVSMFGWWFGQPFNGAVFALATIVLAGLGGGLGGRPVARAPAWAQFAGLAMLAFGWIYPPFGAGDVFGLAYASPFGLLPCPTLAVAIGLALLGDGLSSRLWSAMLASFGLFYGLFGALRLGVAADLGLVAGALPLLVLAATGWRARGGSSR